MFKKLFTLEQDGIGVVEIILILVVIISLVVIFRDQLTSLVNNIFEAISKDTASFIK
jgi:Sec-independent protein translocase protein TatA